MTIYAIGDIHGHLDKLRSAFTRIAHDREHHGAHDAQVVLTGDLVDRGPDSAGVIAWLRALQARDPRVTVLMGNHDQMLCHFMDTGPAPDPRDPPHVRYLSDKAGGRATLASYDVDPTGPPDEVHAEALAKLPRADLDYLAALPLWHRAEGCIFVHAGLRPGVALDEQVTQDLIWIRDDFLTVSHDHGGFVVHGHTPVDAPERHAHRLNIDTGAGYDGPLCVVAIEGAAIWHLTEAGRQAVPQIAGGPNAAS